MEVTANWEHDLMFEVYSNSSSTEQLRMVHRPTGISIQREAKSWERDTEKKKMSEVLKAIVAKEDRDGEEVVDGSPIG